MMPPQPVGLRTPPTLLTRLGIKQILVPGPPASPFIDDGRLPAAKYTVIYPPTINYDYMKQRPQHLMEQFAADGNRVYYMNIRGVDAPPEEVRPNLFVVHRAADIDILPRSGTVVLWMSWPETVTWIDHIRPHIAVYDCLDDFPEWAAAERRIVPRVDLVVATSAPLYQKMRQEHARVVLVRNGCEYERFSDLDAAPDPADWPALQPDQPVVGYVGALGYWIDASIVALIAQHYPMVLVGPNLGHQNIYHEHAHYLGMRPYAALPSYLKRMQVLTIPFALTPLTRATNPIKMYEYLATGRPVVSTAIPEAQGTRLVKVGRTPEEFLQQVDRAARESVMHPARVAARKALARANSWQQRYMAIRDALDAVARERPRM